VRDLNLQNDVLFVGGLPENEKNDALRKSHLLLHTSIREGWGLNVIEANAMGTPAVVYPVHGLTESTLHGQTGWVAETETPQAIFATILALHNNDLKYQNARLQAWERAKAYHWRRVLPQACMWLEEQAVR
jgi:glycosyltransferase involved in cell wall biosynthesis